MKSVLFVYPNTSFSAVIPGAVPILAGIARQRGWATHYFDTFGYDKHQTSQDRSTSGEFKPIGAEGQSRLPFARIAVDLNRMIEREKPDIIAVSAMTIDYELLLKFWHELVVPTHTVTTIGGLHAIVCPEAVIADRLFDVICKGEGEDVFDELLQHVEDGQPLDGIRGTIYVDRKSGVHSDHDPRLLLTPDKLWQRTPNFSIFSDEYFLYPFDGRMVRRYAFEVARGCPYSCTYCGNTALKKAYAGLGRFVRHRPVASIIDGMQRMMADHKIEIFYLMDECFLGHPVPWLKELAAEYSRHIKIPFIAQTRPETVTDEKLDLLEAMGAPFFQVSMGVESGSERILFDVCNRRTPVAKIRAAFAKLHERKIRTAAFFMIGFPYETREEIFETIHLCRDIRPTVSIVSIFQPLHGQDLREVCIREGFIGGGETQLTFTENSMLNMPQISAAEIANLRRVFLLYASLPDEYYDQIEFCERDFEGNAALYERLVALRWELANSPAAAPAG